MDITKSEQVKGLNVERRKRRKKKKKKKMMMMMTMMTIKFGF